MSDVHEILSKYGPDRRRQILNRMIRELNAEEFLGVLLPRFKAATEDEVATEGRVEEAIEHVASAAEELVAQFWGATGFERGDDETNGYGPFTPEFVQKVEGILLDHLLTTYCTGLDDGLNLKHPQEPQE